MAPEAPGRKTMKMTSSRKKRGEPRSAAPEAGPRYIKIAGDLRVAIADGRYPVGAQLPTEHELCGQFGVSRFTIREAIRVLSTAGLVRRKPRAGTVVAALPDETRYTHGIRSLRDLFQYAQTTDFQYVYVGRIALSRAQSLAMSARPRETLLCRIGRLPSWLR